MSVEKRIAQMAMLAYMSGWDRAELTAQLARRYPYGPTIDGNGWSTEQIDAVWALVQSVGKDAR